MTGKENEVRASEHLISCSWDGGAACGISMSQQLVGHLKLKNAIVQRGRRCFVKSPRSSKRTCSVCSANTQKVI